MKSRICVCIRAQPKPYSLRIPSDTLATIGEVAAIRDMSPEALMTLYIGHGLRQDTARLYSERIPETTARVLARHIPSEDERTAILREIEGEAANWRNPRGLVRGYIGPGLRQDLARFHP